MSDCDSIIKKVDTLITAHLNGRKITAAEYKEVDDLLAEYFVEFNQKYPDQPIERNSYLAHYLDEHRFYSGDHYGTPSEFLEQIEHCL